MKHEYSNNECSRGNSRSPATGIDFKLDSVWEITGKIV